MHRSLSLEVTINYLKYRCISALSESLACLELVLYILLFMVTYPVLLFIMVSVYHGFCLSWFRFMRGFVVPEFRFTLVAASQEYCLPWFLLIMISTVPGFRLFRFVLNSVLLYLGFALPGFLLPRS